MIPVSIYLYSPISCINRLRLMLYVSSKWEKNIRSLSRPKDFDCRKFHKKPQPNARKKDYLILNSNCPVAKIEREIHQYLSHECPWHVIRVISEVTVSALSTPRLSRYDIDAPILTLQRNLDKLPPHIIKRLLSGKVLVLLCCSYLDRSRQITHLLIY